MGKSNPVPGAQQPPTSAWEDVGPRDNRRTFILWRSRHRGPVDPSNVELPVVAGALDHPGADDPDNDRGLTTYTSTRSFGKAVGCAQGNDEEPGTISCGEFQTLEAAEAGERSPGSLPAWQHQQKQRPEQQQDERESGQELQQEGVVVVVGGAGRGQQQGRRKTTRTLHDDPPEDPRDVGDTATAAAAAAAAAAANGDRNSASHETAATGFNFRRQAGDGNGGTRSGVRWSESSRVRGFHNMICVGFAVSLCLNLGSLTARQEGFFAAEVRCLPQGAAQTVLPDLGIWVGWRQAVANSESAVVLNLEDLSMVGAAMGILTVVGHATDALLNAVGLGVLLYGRRKPLKETQCRLVKRLCLASLAMAGWLLGMTVIGFLVAVKGPIGAAAVAFYSDLDLDCRSSVCVSVDYAYAMTTLTILCQFFIGIVALPKPSHNRRRRCCCCCCCCHRRRRRRSFFRFPCNPAGWLLFCLTRRRGSSSSQETPRSSDETSSAGMPTTVREAESDVDSDRQK
ncbi:unnamed protein product [Pylaiella littoralis]